MNNALLLTISVAANVSNAIMKKFLTGRFENNSIARRIYCTVTCAVSALALFLMAENLQASLFTVLLALLFGIITALQSIFNLQALAYGPLSYTTVIVSLSMLIPTLSGAIFWNETVVPIQIVGVVLMVGCFILSVNTSGEQKKATFKWLVHCAITFVCTGAIGLMQKIHQSSAHRDELDAFLIIAFVFSCIYAATGWALLSIKKKSEPAAETVAATDRKPILGLLPLGLMVISGVCIAINNKLNLFLSGVMDSAIFFPVVNGVGLILTSLAAFLIFREKLTKRQWIGLALGIVAVLCLCNPFG